MKTEQKCLRIGAFVILLAVFLRFTGSGFMTDMTALLSSPNVSSLLLYAGTGRVYCAQSYDTPSPPQPTESEVTEPPQSSDSPPVQTVFSPDDAVLVSVTNYPGYTIDIPTMLSQPLDWDLTVSEPTVLIFHSHTCESYENTEGYTPSDPYRTRDDRYNMISIGKHLAACLSERGIAVIHDTTVHDYPSYNNAYALSRETVKKYLDEYPSLQLVLDIHRDAYQDAAGNQASDTVNINGQESARLMLVSGTDASGYTHTTWRDNLSVAVKLHTVLEKKHPGLCRDLTMRSYYFNQDLSPGALLVEVGTAGDTRQNALYAAELLADGIAQLSLGSQ